MLPEATPSGASATSSSASSPKEREEVREHISIVCHELAELAYKHGLDSVAVACDVAREVAEGNVDAAQRQVDL